MTTLKIYISFCITLMVLSACATDDDSNDLEPLPTCSELGAGDNVLCPAGGDVCVFEGQACCRPCTAPQCTQPDPRCEASE